MSPLVGHVACMVTVGVTVLVWIVAACIVRVCTAPAVAFSIAIIVLNFVVFEICIVVYYGSFVWYFVELFGDSRANAVSWTCL